ncbi:MAG: hypothetical protein ACXAE3_05240 [Candidatus Kariarchaeaceae archaeon]|jgi:hypothetical protein
MIEQLITSQSINSVLFIELFRSLIGLNLVIFELKTVTGNLRNRTTLTMLGSVFFLNLVFVLRALGIIWDNETIRFFGAAFSGLIAAICLILWGASVIQFSMLKVQMTISSMVFGLLCFLMGSASGQGSLSTFGMAIVATTGGFLVISMIMFIFRKSPYIRARQRMFVLGSGWIFFMIPEGIGILHMGQANYLLAALFFAIALFGRFIMTLGLMMPQRLQEIFLNRLPFFVS